MHAVNPGEHGRARGGDLLLAVLLAMTDYP